jgi:hypothetical protein
MRRAGPFVAFVCTSEGDGCVEGRARLVYKGWAKACHVCGQAEGGNSECGVAFRSASVGPRVPRVLS